MKHFYKKILLVALVSFVIFMGALFLCIERMMAQIEMIGKEYVPRRGIPVDQMWSVTREFEWSVGILGALLFGIVWSIIWMIAQRFSKPIQQIITRISSFQEGKEEFLPRIEMMGDESDKLVSTLNSLNACIQKQMKTLMKERNETEEILGSLGEGVIAVDLQGIVLFANRAACQMFHIPYESLLHQTLSEIQAERASLSQQCDAVIQLAQTREETVVQEISIEETHKIYFNLIATPLAQRNRIILVIQDKTPDYRMLEMGKDFIANASHELRTPITIIRGFAEMLHDVPKLSEQQLEEITATIMRTSLRLDKLINSLLHLADIEHFNEERLQKVDPMAVCEQCMEQLRKTHPDTELKLHQKIEQAWVRADKDLLEMAIMNLLQNAVKYSPSPARIDLTIDQYENHIRIAVKDQGIGMPREDLPHVFDRFYTVDKARSRKFGGAGLGLSIVKAIVQKHHGSVEVASQLGQGSTFALSFPIQK